MIDLSLGIFVNSLPWWLALPLLQLSILVVGMALDETYVNRATVLMGAVAVYMYVFLASDVGLFVGLYADVGLVVGAYGMYAYVIDGYVGNWFRLLAYYVYSPLSAFLVVLTAGPTLFGVDPLVLPALAAAGYVNYQFREYLRPRQPFYFGPRTYEEFEAALDADVAANDPVEHDGDRADGSRTSASAGTASTGATAPEASAPSDTEVAEDAGTATARSSDPPSPDGESGASNTVESRGAPPAEQPGEAKTDTESFDEPTVDSGTDVEPPGAEPAAAAEGSERGILPKFMRRL